MGGTLITQHPQAKLQEVKGKESPREKGDHRRWIEREIEREIRDTLERGDKKPGSQSSQ